jgi:drug/metabolite transporter (DMT)-like permease
MSIFGRLSLRRYSPATAMVYALCIGALFLLPLAARESAAFWAGWSTPRAAALLLYAGLVPTTVSFLLYTTGLGLLQNAGRASVLATVEPLAAAISGYVVLGEALTAAQWLGGALILGGVLLLRRS